jgi:succinate-acetate transporter protein
MPAPSAGGINAFLILWCLFTVILFIATLKLPKILQILFGALILLFVLLIAGSLTGNPAITTAAGYEGVVVGLLSLYASSAFLLNEIYGKTVLPIG